MKAPDRITTIAIATIATVLLATVGYAVAGPSASGPSDDELPVIATTVLPRAADASAGVTPPPLAGDAATDEHVEGVEDGDDDHETVAPSIRVEDPDDDDDSDVEDKKSPDADDDEHDGESSESTKADEPH